MSSAARVCAIRKVRLWGAAKAWIIYSPLLKMPLEGWRRDPFPRVCLMLASAELYVIANFILMSYLESSGMYSNNINNEENALRGTVQYKEAEFNRVDTEVRSVQESRKSDELRITEKIDVRSNIFIQ